MHQSFVSTAPPPTGMGRDSFVCFVALPPKSTAMVMAGRSVHLTTLFSWASLNKQLTNTLCTYFRLYSNFFHFQSPDISPALWKQADVNNPTLCPALHYKKSHQGRFPNVITPTLPPHCGDNQKVLALHRSPAIPPLSP